MGPVASKLTHTVPGRGIESGIGTHALLGTALVVGVVGVTGTALQVRGTGTVVGTASGATLGGVEATVGAIPGGGTIAEIGIDHALTLSVALVQGTRWSIDGTIMPTPLVDAFTGYPRRGWRRVGQPGSSQYTGALGIAIRGGTTGIGHGLPITKGTRIPLETHTRSTGGVRGSGRAGTVGIRTTHAATALAMPTR